MSRPSKKPVILSVDDEPDILRLIERFLSKIDCTVMTVDEGPKGLEIARRVRPSLILLDILMPGMDGYEFCAILQKNIQTAYIPVIFVTALGDEQNKAKAFAAGAVDYLVKPLRRDILLDKIGKHIKTDNRWINLKQDNTPWDDRLQPSDYVQFKEFLFNQLELGPEKKYSLAKTSPSKIYDISSSIGINESRMAQYIAEFLNLSYLSSVNPEDVQLGILPTPFCKSNNMAPIGTESGEMGILVSNPFDWERMEGLKRFTGLAKGTEIIVTEPENILFLFKYETSSGEGQITGVGDKPEEFRPIITTKEEAEPRTEKQATVYIANSVLGKAVSKNASDIHILPKDTETVIRFRIDGDLVDFFKVKKQTGIKLISRFKVLAGLDIGEKRKPQDGAFRALIDGRTFNLRVSSFLTQNGENAVIRVLEPYLKPKPLEELGLSGRQSDILLNMGYRSQGLILIVGPTGSGKTTTIYSLLHNIDCQTRSLISVEDPVEYRIPFANQQQVNEKIGVTFEALLKSAVRQDPDILFMGEVRDAHSAKIAMDFASTGHLILTTLHTSNATTAIFRLERLGVDRGAMADTLRGIVAQKLLKKLCPHCKKVLPISDKEAEMLSPFTEIIPSEVAHPNGCLECGNTGYRGREGVYEVIEFNAELSEMVRENAPISEIRAFAAQVDNFLISNHAVEKVRSLIFSPMDVYERVLVEEGKIKKPSPKKSVTRAVPTKTKTHPSVLVVDDDLDTRRLVALLLKNRGCDVTASDDGISALINLAQKHFDLIISDVNMPNLDGFKLLEMINQKGINTPVIFLTGRTRVEDEMRGLKLGAMDYLKKPIKKDVFLLRVKKVLGKIQERKRNAAARPGPPLPA